MFFLATEGHLEIVQELLKNGATINVSDRWGCTPLQDAVRFQHEGIVGVLENSDSQTQPTKIATSPQSRISLQQTLNDIAKPQGWDYAGAYYILEDNMMRTSDSWYAERGLFSNLNYNYLLENVPEYSQLRRNVVKRRFSNIDEYDRVFKEAFNT